MALADVINLTITRHSRPLERAGFGTMLFLAMHRAWSDRIKYYDQPDDMLDDGFSSTDEAYRAAVSYFAQSPKPEQIAIGRLATADAVSLLVDTVANAYRYKVWLDGIGFDYTSDATATTNEIEAGLTSVINDGYTIGAASTSAKTFTITGNHLASIVAGEQFRVIGSSANDGTYTVASAILSSGNTVIAVDEAIASESGNMGAVKSLNAVTATNSLVWDGVISIAPDVASTVVRMTAGDNLHLEYDLSGTMAANLTAIEAEDSTGWYAVSLAHQWETTASPAADNDQVDVEEALADLIETRRKLFVQASPASAIIDSTLAADDPTTGSIAARVKDKGYARTAILYSGQADNGLDIAGGSPDPYADAAWLGSRLPWDPGRETWKFAKLTGVSSDDLTTTQRTNCLAKSANCYAPFTTSRAITEDGTVATGEFIDVIRLIDAIYDAVTTEVADALLNPESPLAKVPYTDEGIAVIEAAIRKALDPYTGTTRGLASYTVTVPTAASVSATDKANRVLRGVSFTGVLSGAVHSTVITGNVTV